MTKFKLGLAASAAAILAFGVAACGQTTAAPEETPAVEEAVGDAAVAVEGAADAATDAATAVEGAAAGEAPAAPPAP
jgi:hypothetical protein